MTHLILAAAVSAAAPCSLLTPAEVQTVTNAKFSTSQPKINLFTNKPYGCLWHTVDAGISADFSILSGGSPDEVFNRAVATYEHHSFGAHAMPLHGIGDKAVAVSSLIIVRKHGTVITVEAARFGDGTEAENLQAGKIAAKIIADRL